MLRQIRYFQSVVRNNNFSEAAEECHISQSAISQQIQALERELGFALLERHNRKFTLTPAGEHFYRKSLVLVSDFDRLRAEAAKIANGGETILRIGFPRCYGGQEFHRALAAFSARYPDVTVQLIHGNHEELLMRTGNVDISMNDQRRAFSSEYENMVLTELPTEIELSARSPMAALPSITPQDLKSTPCILVSAPAQQATEQDYYANIVGLQGEFLFVENMEEARLAVIGGKGYLPIEGGTAERVHGLARVPLYRDGTSVTRTYCAFWRKVSPPPYAAEFAALLKEQF